MDGRVFTVWFWRLDVMGSVGQISQFLFHSCTLSLPVFMCLMLFELRKVRFRPFRIALSSFAFEGRLSVTIRY